MEKIIVKGGKSLKGTVKPEGAKNAVLPILAGTILATEGTTVLSNTPILADVTNMEKVLNHINIDTNFDRDNNVMEIESSDTLNPETPYELMNLMRASVVVLGPLLARNGYAKVAMPGGCAIGQRPIDLHLKGFEALGATIEIDGGNIIAKADGLTGADIYLNFPSVGATENIMMAATRAKGTTVIENAAREPEIVDLATFLNKMGADIKGAGTNEIRIVGVDKLHGVEHSIIPDRIESGTFAVAAAVTQGDVFIEDFETEHNRPLISKLREMGVTIEEKDGGIRVVGPERLKPTTVETQPYPGFPTDMQSQMTVAQALADGTSVMKETVFENRFMHLKELNRMNVEYEVDGQSAIIHGRSDLQGAEVMSSDLRAAAALITAGLVADGYTRVNGLNHLDRGYYKFTEKLQALGADVQRVDFDKIESNQVDYASMFESNNA